jgi:hypothetical protein
MMVNARGPVWHQQQKKPGLVPTGLQGLDKAATWGQSRADGWVDGHGTFSLTAHQVPMVGLLQWMSKAGHEAQRLEQEVITSEGLSTKVCMDSKADDQALSVGLKHNDRIQLVTVPRQGLDTSAARNNMIKQLLTKQHKQADKDRATTVEPRQGLVATIFALERCWMRGEVSNRWLLAAMGVAVQMAPWTAWQHNRSTWNGTSDGLGR